MGILERLGGIFTFSGRRNRVSFLVAALSLILGSVLISFLPARSLLLGLGPSVICLYGLICIAAQRLHDLGRSGALAWLILGLQVVGNPILLFALGQGLEHAQGSSAMVLQMAVYVGAICLFLWLGSIAFLLLWPGERWPNAYGPPS